MTFRKLVRLLVVLGLLTIGFAVAAGGRAPRKLPQIRSEPGSAARGAALFEEKKCLQCHAFEGRGGTRAPDLAQRSERSYTPALLAISIWNHSPAMWAAMGSDVSRLRMNSGETADLFAYFYSRMFFSIPGDAARGKVVFEEKNCAGCHVSKPGQNTKGPPLTAWAQVKDPITWAERMWNHSRRMDTTMMKAGLSWPQISAQEMVDLLIYIRSLPATRSQTATFQPGEPDLGRIVYERNCESCHTFGSTQPNKVDLLRSNSPRSLTDYVADMWNHAPMLRRLSGRESATLSPGDMKNLVAYLFAQRYFLEPGSASRGRVVYREKRCEWCHEERRLMTGAPDLTQVTEQFSPVVVATAVWRHGPTMLDTMKKNGFSWPEFHGSEMTNLIAYMNSRLNPKIAPLKP
jgi:cytochrome c2